MKKKKTSVKNTKKAVKTTAVTCCTTNNKMLICGLLAAVALMVIYLLMASSKNNYSARNIVIPTVAPKPTPTKEQLVTFVKDAVALVKEQGEKAYPLFRQQGGRWWQENSYIFVYDLNGKTLVLPPQTQIEGTNRWNTKDENGLYYVREMINQLKKASSGWITYVYPKPGETTASPKTSYFEKVKVGSKYILVGSGMYLK